MTLDKLKIGVRIRNIREEMFKMTRQNFAENCGISENHLGKIERGEILLSITTLSKISTASGISTDYILFGKSSNKNLNIRDNIDYFLDNSSKEELKMYYKIISMIKSLNIERK